MTTIYKKDNKDKLRYLTITAVDGHLIQTSGLLDTTQPLTASKLCKGKNIGKSNETTPQEQAIKGCDSKIEEKLRQGYFKTKEEAQAEGGKDFLMPMLAKDFKDFKNEIEFPCFVQPKLDGCRSLSSIERPFVSRTNKEFGTLNHIKLPDYPGVTFDGEAYAHGLSFQENMKIIKKYRKGETENVKYHIYDYVDNQPFNVRNSFLHNMVRYNPNIILVPTYIVKNMEDIKNYHSRFLAEGYEGTMIRWGQEGYDINKRSKYLLKYKDFIDETYKIIDVIPNDANPAHGTVKCQMNIKKWYTLDGTGNVNKIQDKNFKGATFGYAPFKTGMKLSHEERVEILLNKENYIGKLAEVRFFEFTDNGIPRFPVYYGYRIDK